MYSANPIFVGVPPHCVCSSGTILSWECTLWSAPSDNTINNIHDHPEAKQLGGQSGDLTDFYALKLSEWWHITHHECACFLEDQSANHNNYMRCIGFWH